MMVFLSKISAWTGAVLMLVLIPAYTFAAYAVPYPSDTQFGSYSIEVGQPFATLIPSSSDPINILSTFYIPQDGASTTQDSIALICEYNQSSTELSFLVDGWTGDTSYITVSNQKPFLYELCPPDYALMGLATGANAYNVRIKYSTSTLFSTEPMTSTTITEYQIDTPDQVYSNIGYDIVYAVIFFLIFGVFVLALRRMW